jgi:hypothetical protein
VPIWCQLNLTDSLYHILWKGIGVHGSAVQVMCNNEFRFGGLAQSLLRPGLLTLLTNIVRNTSKATSDCSEAAEKVLSSNGFDGPDDLGFLVAADEYVRGASQEMYVFQICLSRPHSTSAAQPQPQPQPPPQPPSHCLGCLIVSFSINNLPSQSDSSPPQLRLIVYLQVHGVGAQGPV